MMVWHRVWRFSPSSEEISYGETRVKQRVLQNYDYFVDNLISKEVFSSFIFF